MDLERALGASSVGRDLGALGVFSLGLRSHDVSHAHAERMRREPFAESCRRA